ncbi:Ig-like domain-containing protein [Nocardioides alkalitolerans]|uniref:Ig-like domain-containing protein n=1 Tax=Nocardioides alkalitolerans TaxID=281714 RepID=UPI0004062B38|nr:Ig-like domain-containing protein [Nocardioides alkalitolerans]
MSTRGTEAGRGRRRAALASYLALALAATAFVVYAASADGVDSHEADLNDGGVWVTNNTDSMYGRVNKPIGQIDSALFAQLDARLDIVQDGAAVIGFNSSAGVLAPLDPATVQHPEGEQASVGPGSQVRLAGGTAAVLDPTAGAVWVQRMGADAPYAPVATLDAQATPAAELAGASSLAVGTDGTTWVLAAGESTLTRLDPAGTGVADPATDELDATLGEQSVVTAVGGLAVVLDPDAGRLLVPGAGDGALEVDLADELSGEVVLQQAGPGADGVLVADGTRLLEVDLTDGAVTEVAATGGGTPTPPVRLGACRYGAWSGDAAAVATQCGDLGDEGRVAGLATTATDLVFRVNRGEILLNDRLTGAVWDIDSDQPARLDNWDAFRERTTDEDDNEENETESDGDRRPPVANDDAFGARPGQTAVLHPLDNDTAPEGRLLSIRSVDAPVGNDVDLTVSPDGQTVQIRLPEGAAPTTTFGYTIDDGRADVSASATVTVETRTAGENNAPQLRELAPVRDWVVPVGGVLDLPVLPDWRDRLDSDPLTLTTAVVGGDPTGTTIARPTADGRIRFEAGYTAGVRSVRYEVSDGVGETVAGELDVRVQDSSERTPVSPVAEPDVVSGEVGEPITIRPLANDLPGSDPGTPDAELALAGPAQGTGDAVVETDLAGGTLSFRAPRATTYFLDYGLAYGNAAPVEGRIRVDVAAPRNPPAVPVAMPDQLTLHGQAASIVDVLANDVDPRGGLLVVQTATARTADQLDVAVVDGRWLRIAAQESELQPNPQVVSYTISNGAGAEVEGEVVVSQRPVPDDTAPVTQTDRLVIRSGAVATVPVLDNDFSPSGETLTLVPEAEGLPRGELAAVSVDGTVADVGRAFVSGRQVRYVAPSGLTEPLSLQVTYLAGNAAGERSPGRIEVTVIPAAAVNRPPEPPTLEGRTVAGERLVIRLPGGGVDPDGDAVTVTGIASAPALGRVLRYGANSLEYQAYPGAGGGTDEFAYTVVDPSGEEASGTVRVAVVPPGDSQPPLAVDDVATVEPGRDLRVDVLSNDVTAPGDRVTVELVDPPEGVSLDSASGPLRVSAPTEPGAVVEAVYEISNGLASSRATVTVRTASPYNNPPVVYDAFGEADAGESVGVDVLEEAFDPDGPDDGLVVTDVFAPDGVVATTDGRAVEVTRSAHPVVVGFRVEDADGGAAVASLFVPAALDGAPYLREDGVIRVGSGQSTSEQLGEYVVDPSGGEVSFTLTDRIWTSPAAEVSVEITGDQTFDVQAVDGYRGPAAVVAEVTTGSGVDDPEGVRAFVSIPVQVGDAVPILSCPTAPVEVVQGREIALDVAVRCHVWTSDPTEELSFDSDWETSVDGLSIIEASGPVVTVSAAANAAPGSEAQLSLTSGDSDPGLLTVRVVEAPRPRMAPVNVSDMRAGEERTIELAPYLRSGVDDPEPTLVEVTEATPIEGVEASRDGSSGLRISTADRVDGVAEFRVTMSDVADGGPERQVEGTVRVEILDRPDTPAAPVPVPGVRSQEVGLQWVAPEANGAPVRRYEVRHAGGTQVCPAARCDIVGLTNGEAYTFEVRAENAIGWSDWSPASAAATPDAPPGAVGGIAMVARGDGTITLRWTEPTTETSAIERYYVQWPGGQRQVATPEVVVTGLDNNRTYQFRISAENAYDEGPATASAVLQSIGAPGTPAAPTVEDRRTPGDAGAIELSWAAVDANGPTPVLYTVRRDGAPLAQCTNLTSTRCVDSGLTYDGTTYSYDVTATNNNGLEDAVSSTGPAATWTAVGTPAEWGDWSIEPTGQDGQARVRATVPSSRGGASRVTIVAGGATRFEQDVRGGLDTTISGLSNGGPTSAYLRVCNESGACSQSGTRSVQTYGPLRQEHLVSVDPIVDGNSVRFRIRVNTNGDPAQVLVDQSYDGGDGGAGATTTRTYEANSVGAWEVTTSAQDGGFNSRHRIAVRLQDNAPGRGPVTATAEVRTQRRPDPTVAVSRGDACRDRTANPCRSRPSDGSECLVDSCGRIVISMEGFTSNQTCTINTNTGGGFGQKGPYGNGRHQTSAYYGFPGGWVTATCGGITSPRYTWP